MFARKCLAVTLHLHCLSCYFTLLPSHDMYRLSETTLAADCLSYSSITYPDIILRYLKNKSITWCHLLFYFTFYVLNMFRTLIYPSPGACDYSVELPHWSYCSWFDVCWSFGVVGLEWYPCCRLKHLASVEVSYISSGPRPRIPRILLGHVLEFGPLIWRH